MPCAVTRAHYTTGGHGLRVSVAGKTGSAQNDQGDGMTHSWFAGFACVVENGGAARAAAAVCREIIRKALQ